MVLAWIIKQKVRHTTYRSKCYGDKFKKLVNEGGEKIVAESIYLRPFYESPIYSFAVLSNLLAYGYS